MILAYLLLLTGLTISAVAIYYSVVGLTAIFSAAAIPIIIMGSALEVGKLVCASWLKSNWDKAPGFMKYYMTTAVVVLMLITSMGIFGFLSKAHNDQNLVSGDVQSKIAIYDEKIKTARENIEADRKQLRQMDEAVDQLMGRSTDEKGADKANAVRKSQQRDRVSLAKDIESNQKAIAQLNDEAAPIRAEVRKVDAEVGPIKYIAAFIYGTTPDASMLERAVTWIIIMIVVVFDPLAVIMLLASQMTFAWKKEEKNTPAYKPDDGLLSEEYLEAFRKSIPTPPENTVTTSSLFPESDSALDPCYKCGTPLIIAPGIGPFCPNKECDVKDNISDAEIEFVTPKLVTTEPVDNDDDYYYYGDDSDYDEELIKESARSWKAENPNDTLKRHYQLLEQGKIKELPWMRNEFKLQADNEESTPSAMKGFGIQFPEAANKGDMFLRVDQIPSMLYKYNGTRWIEVDKDNSDQYAYDSAYIDHLISKLESGEYEIDMLSDAEKDQITNRLAEK
jgi:hypothetical protein